jgi:hypothetical protein
MTDGDVGRPLVLVVDDDRDVRAALALLLEGHGHETRQAGSGAERLTNGSGGSSAPRRHPRAPAGLRSRHTVFHVDIN